MSHFAFLKRNETNLSFLPDWRENSYFLSHKI